MNNRRGIFMEFTVQEGDLPPKGVIDGVGTPHAGTVRLIPHGLSGGFAENVLAGMESHGENGQR